MSATATRRPRLEVGVLALAAGAFLLAAALLAPGGSVGTLRTIVGVLALLVLPGWLVGRLVDEEADAIVRLAGGTVATLAVVAASGFVAFELGLRVATAVVAVPLLVVVAVAALLGALRPGTRRAPLGPPVAALALGAATLLGAMGVHLMLPAPPIQPAFSIEATAAVVSPSRVAVPVTVTRVATGEPTTLNLYVDGALATPSPAVVPAGRAQSVTVTATLPAGASCSARLRVRVVATNGAFLTPPVTCVKR